MINRIHSSRRTHLEATFTVPVGITPLPLAEYLTPGKNYELEARTLLRTTRQKFKIGLTGMTYVGKADVDSVEVRKIEGVETVKRERVARNVEIFLARENGKYFLGYMRAYPPGGLTRPKRPHREEKDRDRNYGLEDQSKMAFMDTGNLRG